MDNKVISKEYYYILKAYNFPITRFDTKEELAAFIEKNKIPYTNYVVDRHEKGGKYESVQNS